MAQQFGQTAAQDGHAMAPNQTQFTLSRRIAPLHEADIDAEPLKLRASMSACKLGIGVPSRS